MDEADRAELEALHRVVYARPGPGTDEAVRRLRALRVRLDAPPLPREPLVEPATRRRSWRALVIGVGALAAASVLAITMVALAPEAPAQPRSIAGGDRAVPAGVQPRIVVEPPPNSFEVPADLPPFRAPDGGEVLDRFGLGKVGNETLYGFTTSAGSACLALATGSSRSGTCVTAAAFADRGVGIDRGWWGVTWFPDGRLEWDGV